MEEVRHISFVVTTASAGLELEVSRIEGREAISQLFEYEVLASYRQEGAGGVTAEDLLGQEAVLLIYRSKNKSPEIVRRIHGMIAAVNDRLETQADFSSFRIRFVPRAYRLSLVEQQDVLLDVDLATLIRQKMEAASFKDDDYKIKLFDRYRTRELVVQYRESDLAFIARQCEHVGVSYHFEHEEGRDVMVFTDRNEVFPEIQGTSSLPYRPRGEHHEVYRFEENLCMIPAQYVVRDYNYRNPQMDVTGQAMFDEGKGLVVEYGTHVKSPDEAEALAKVRAEERIVSRRQFDGTCDVERVAAGRRFVLAEHPMGDMRLLVTEVRIEGALSAYGAGIAEGEQFRFECQFKAIREATRHRPARVTPRPRIYGVINAVVEAEEKGQYAEVDDQGRYLVKFMFDTTTPDGRRPSRYVRMAQPHTGAGYGVHFPLRAGVEVLISFVDGDPDRPIITAAVPNPQTASPVVKENRTRNVVRTGGGNEINFDDTEEGQRIKMHSPYASTTFQLGAPNSPESGAALETWGARSELAFSGTSTLSTWNANLNMAQSVMASGNVIVNAGSEPASTGQWVLWAANLATNSIGAMADVALKTVEIMKKKEELKLAQEKAKKTEAEVTFEEAVEARVQESLRLSPGRSYAEVRTEVQRDIDNKAAPVRTKFQVGGTTTLGTPPTTFGDAILALTNDPTNVDAQNAVQAFVEQYNTLQTALANSPDARASIHAELQRMGTLLGVFVKEGGKTAPFAMPPSSSSIWTTKRKEYETADSGLKDLLATGDASASTSAGGTTLDPLVELKLQLDLTRAEYERKEFEANHGEHARALKQAEQRLNVIKKVQDGAASISAWYSTIMGILGTLNESSAVSEMKGRWDAASMLLAGANHRKEESKRILGQTMPSYVESVSGMPALIAVVGAGIVGPVAAAGAKLALEGARKTFKMLATTPSGTITGNSPEPTYNIQSSEGTAAVMGKKAAMVSGQVTVLLGEVDRSPPDAPSTLMGEMTAGFAGAKSAVMGMFRGKTDLAASAAAALGVNTVANAGTVAVVGETQVMIASPALVEVASADQVSVTSSNVVDVWGEKTVTIHAGTRPTATQATSDWGMHVDAPGKKVTCGHLSADWKCEITDLGFHLGHATKKIALDSRDEDTILSHGETNAKLTERGFQLGHAGQKVALESIASDTTLSHGGSRALLTAQTITLKTVDSVRLDASKLILKGTKVMIG